MKDVVKIKRLYLLFLTVLIVLCACQNDSSEMVFLRTEESSSAASGRSSLATGSLQSSVSFKTTTKLSSKNSSSKNQNTSSAKKASSSSKSSSPIENISQTPSLNQRAYDLSVLPAAKTIGFSFYDYKYVPGKVSPSFSELLSYSSSVKAGVCEIRIDRPDKTYPFESFPSDYTMSDFLSYRFFDSLVNSPLSCFVLSFEPDDTLSPSAALTDAQKLSLYNEISELCRNISESFGDSSKTFVLNLIKSDELLSKNPSNTVLKNNLKEYANLIQKAVSDCRNDIPFESDFGLFFSFEMSNVHLGDKNAAVYSVVPFLSCDLYSYDFIDFYRNTTLLQSPSLMQNDAVKRVSELQSKLPKSNLFKKGNLILKNTFCQNNNTTYNALSAILAVNQSFKKDCKIQLILTAPLYSTEFKSPSKFEGKDLKTVTVLNSDVITRCVVLPDSGKTPVEPFIRELIGRFQ